MTQTPDLLFLDTETTGILKDDRIIELAFSFASYWNMVVIKIKPPVEMSKEAEMVTGITQEMIDQEIDRVVLMECKDYSDIRQTIENNIVVAHNANFDIGMLKKEKIFVKQWIDTLKVARALFPNLKNHSLQFLREYFNLDIQVSAHNAGDDVIVLEHVFTSLELEFLRRNKDKNTEFDFIKWSIELSHTPQFLAVMPFGKYKGELIAQLDKNYLTWLYDRLIENSDRSEDLLYTLKIILNL